MRFSICLSYDGAQFCGWQIQNGAPSVQECLQDALSRLLGRPISVTGCGRTDTSVNALGYIAHFDVDGELPFGQEDLCYKLNAILPRSVAVHGIVPASDDFHSRYDAVRREYTYFINRKKDPFVRAYSWQCGYPSLDFEAMNEACRHLLGTHSFDCFEKTGGSNKTSVCTVYEAFWAPYTPSHLSVMETIPEGDTLSQTHGHPRPCKREGPIEDGRGLSEAKEVWDSVSPSGKDYWYFRISADRFLRNMVRAVVGSLIEVGRGKHSPEWIAELIASGTRSDAGESVPGHALFLGKVLY